MAPAWNAGREQSLVGSNPTLSATPCRTSRYDMVCRRLLTCCNRVLLFSPGKRENATRAHSFRIHHLSFVQAIINYTCLASKHERIVPASLTGLEQGIDILNGHVIMKAVV